MDVKLHSLKDVIPSEAVPSLSEDKAQSRNLFGGREERFLDCRAPSGQCAHTSLRCVPLGMTVPSALLCSIGYL